MEHVEKRMGWEIAQEFEKARPSVMERLKPDRKALVAAFWGFAVFFAVFLLSCWLAGNPFEGTGRVSSEFVKAKGWVGTNNWGIFWWIVGLAILLEFLDASAGMGYGAAMTPLLLVLGFDPLQVVPAVMIQQATAGMVGAFLHKEFGNVEWKLKPMTEPIKLWLIIAITGCITVSLSVTAIYAVFKVAKVWIKLYVVVLLLLMGVSILVRSNKDRPYKPMKMLFYGALAAFNKGVGGGGYGPGQKHVGRNRNLRGDRMHFFHYCLAGVSDRWRHHNRLSHPAFHDARKHVRGHSRPVRDSRVSGKNVEMGCTYLLLHPGGV